VKPWLFAIAAIVVHIALFFFLRAKPIPPRFDLQPSQRPSPETAMSIPGGERVESKCFQTYLRLYEKDEVDMRVVFGYKDARPARFVGDRYERIALVEYLLRPCAKNFHACGFARIRDDADLLTKTVIGPDGRDKLVNLHVVQASAGPDDDENRKSDSFQAWQSAHATKIFEQGLREADVVLYSGHSRDGGGPDFAPPKLNYKGHVNYYWYGLKKPGLKAVVRQLRNAKRTPKLFGLLSCTSDKHFSDEVGKVAKPMGLLTSPKLLYYADAMKNLLGTLSALLGMWCKTDFDLAIQAGTDDRSSQLDGFFK